MSLSVRFSRPWSYAEDRDGNVKRSIPSGWSGELADDVAAAAIFDGVGTPNGPITPDVQHYIDVFAMIATGATEAEVEAHIMRLPSLQVSADPNADPPHDPETGEILDDAPPAAADAPAPKKRKAAG